jgi:hypothetical protein
MQLELYPKTGLMRITPARNPHPIHIEFRFSARLIAKVRPQLHDSAHIIPDLAIFQEITQFAQLIAQYFPVEQAAV